MILYHGTTRTEFPRHVGLCLCESAQTAAHYAGPSGTVYAVEIDEDALDWVTVDGYDRDTNEAPADRNPAALAAEHGVEAVWFSDEDPHQRAHDTLRLLTPAAVAAIISATAI
jgi:hypothetical protein